MSSENPLIAILDQFQVASLDDINRLKLFNRVDQKFIFKYNELESVLKEVLNDYNILSINEKRLLQYNTLYFDTSSYSSYTDHHNGRPNRYKIRYRKYQDSGDVFFEIKKKIKGLRTNKHRIQTVSIPQMLGNAEKELLSEYVKDGLHLVPTMWVNYKRLTLMNRNSEERVTIDLNLHLKNEIAEISLEGLVIVEVKQAKASRNSQFLECLRKRQLRETRISKYTIAVALLNHNIKRNAFGSKLRKIKHLIEDQWKQAS